jgi:hypothetical protein
MSIRTSAYESGPASRALQPTRRVRRRHVSPGVTGNWDYETNPFPFGQSNGTLNDLNLYAAERRPPDEPVTVGIELEEPAVNDPSAIGAQQ